MLSADARPLVIGHRGASADAPENTIAAFELALEQGADGIELDVHLSADEQPVVIHDFTLEPTTDGAGPVSGTASASSSGSTPAAGTTAAFGASACRRSRRSWSASGTARASGSS
jgi:glycerophosphoryl diester phosphodiesterase